MIRDPIIIARFLKINECNILRLYIYLETNFFSSNVCICLSSISYGNLYLIIQNFFLFVIKNNINTNLLISFI